MRRCTLTVERERVHVSEIIDSTEAQDEIDYLVEDTP